MALETDWSVGSESQVRLISPITHNDNKSEIISINKFINLFVAIFYILLNISLNFLAILFISIIFAG